MSVKVSAVQGESPLGPIAVLATAEGVCWVDFDNLAAAKAAFARYAARWMDQPVWTEVPHPAAVATLTQLREYFDGKRQAFDVSLVLHGTAFQKRVWHELMRIPYGHVVSYQEIARRLGHPRAVRAVGQAVGRNPLAILVPCHRVVGADGSLVGYASGLERKRWLLVREGVWPLDASARA